MSSFQSLTTESLPGAVRYVLQQECRSSFRWLFLVEVFLALLLFVCLIPVLIVLAIATQGNIDGIDLESMGRRMYREWMELRFAQLAADGTELAHASTAPRDDAARDAAISAVLALAKQEQMVVVETLGGRVGEVLNVWYGGRPFLSPPKGISPERASRSLKTNRIEEQDDPQQWQAIIPQPDYGRLLSALLFLVFLPLVVWTSSGRARLATLWRTATTGHQPALHLHIDTDGIRIQGIHHTHENLSDQFLPEELLGVAWSSTMSTGKHPRRTNPRLRIVGKTRTRTLRVPESVGAALCARMISVLLERSVDESAFSGRTHCPYCGTMYDVGIHDGCVSCGAPPTQLTGKW